MARKKIEDATLDELMAFATNDLNLDVDASADRDQLVELISSASSRTTIDVADAPENAPSPAQIVQPASTAKPVAESKADPNEAEMVEITIQASQDPKGNEPLYVGVNGSGIFIPRGQRVKIKRKFYDALNNAVGDSFAVGEDGRIGIATEVHSYPFTVHSGV